MFKSRIGARLLLSLLLLALAPILVLGEVLSRIYEANLIEQAQTSVSEIADKKTDQIRTYVDEKLGDVILLSKISKIKDDFASLLEIHGREGYAGPGYIRMEQRIRESYKHYIDIGDYYDLFFISPSGEIFLTVKHESDFATNILTGDYKDTELARVSTSVFNFLEPEISRFRVYAPSNAPAAFLAAPMIHEGRIIGTLATQTNTDRLLSVITDDTGLDDSGETVAGDRVGNETLIIAPLKHRPDSALKLKFDWDRSAPQPLAHALRGDRGHGRALDYRGKDVLAAWRYIPSAHIGMDVKVDTDRTLAVIGRINQWKYSIAAAILLFIIITAGYLTRSIVRPLSSLEKVTASIASGDMSQRAGVESPDEIGKLAGSFNMMADKLKDSYGSLEAKVATRTSELQAEINQRREVERRLAQTASLQRAILDSANFTIISTDPDGVIQTFSATAERLLGYAAADIVGKKTPAIFHDPAEVVKRARELTDELGMNVEPGFEAFVAKVKATNRPDEREWTYIAKDGRKFPVRLSITALKNDSGEITGFLGVGFDITVQKRDEERLRQSEERWKFALEGAGDGVWDWNVPTSEVMFSRRWKEMLGFADDEIDSNLDEWAKRVHPDDMPRVMADIQAHMDGKTSVYVNEHRVLCKDGSWKWILDRGMLISRAPDGKPLRMIGTHADITERKNAEDALFRNKEALAMAQRIVNLGSWDWDIVTGDLTWSDEIYRIFGLHPQEFGATYEAFLSYIHQEDRGKVTAAVNDAVTKGVPYDIEHRVVRPNGEVRHVHERGEVTRGENGAPTRMLGTVHDITEKKIAEEGLRLSQKVFQSAGEAIVITDAAIRIIDVNPAYELITGYSRDEVIGKNPSISQSGHHDDAYYETMWREINTKGKWSGEMWDRRKNGEPFPTILTINVIKDDFGNPTYYVGVFMDITRQKSTEEKLERLAYYDPLTRLPNRALFRDRLRHAIDSAKRLNGSVALFFIDLDRFKHVNDTLGHAIGDELLVDVSRRVTACVRKSDTVCRLGGDEFTVILEDVRSSEDAAHVAGEIITSVAHVFRIKGHEIFVGASVGIGIYPTDGQTDEELVKNADMAMYQAKSAGRGVYKFFTKEMNERAVTRQKMESGIRRALLSGEFGVYYQPKIDLATGSLAGAEALIRWIHPAGVIQPDSFIPIAEETGLILEIDDYVLAKVCADLNNWRSKGNPDLRVSVNISARHFQSRRLVESLQSILSSTQTLPDNIEIEITESAIMQDAAASIETLQTIRDMGIHLSIDDFGTGYSSLSYLKKFPVDILKIDKSFVIDLIKDKDNQAIVSSIVSMGKTMGLKIVAEGVETAEQASILKEFGAHMGQGYHYAKPLSPADFEAFLKNSA